MHHAVRGFNRFFGLGFGVNGCGIWVPGRRSDCTHGFALNTAKKRTGPPKPSTVEDWR